MRVEIEMRKSAFNAWSSVVLDGEFKNASYRNREAQSGAI